jgi:hypothetical protein
MMEETAKRELLAAFWADPILAFRTALPHWFPKKMHWTQRGIAALVLGRCDFLLKFGKEYWAEEEAEWTVEDLQMILEHFRYSEDPDDPQAKTYPLFEWRDGVLHMVTSRFMSVMMPRGFSKTTLFNALIWYCIGFKIEDYILYISETGPHAEQQLQNVKNELEANEVGLELFGELAPDRNDPEKWTGKDIQTTTGVRVQAIGRGGQVRGKNFRGIRPGLILCDDIEDEESVATDEQRLKVRNWLYGAVRPALPKRKGKLFLLGTMLHSEGLMMAVTRDKLFVSVRFGAMMEDGKALWSLMMTEKEWLHERETFKAQGLLSRFYMEFQSSIHVDADSRKFKPEHWKQVVRTRDEFVAVAMACDPAISSDRRAASFVVVVAGMTKYGVIHILDMWSKVGASPREQVDEYFRLHFLWGVERHGVESIAYQAALIHLLQEEMARQSTVHGYRAYFEIVPITHGKKKETRIEGILSPRYAAGYITHQRRFRELESEALDWPNGKKDHLDAAAMAVSLLDPVAMFAGPPEEVLLPPSQWREVQEAHQQCP